MKRYSDEDLASIAEGLRKRLGLRLEDKVNMLDVVQHFQNAKDPIWRITFQEVPASFMRQALALAEPLKRTIYHTKDLKDRLRGGDSRAGLVFLEEICHVLLKHDARVLNHSVGRDVRMNAMPELAAMEDEAERMQWFFIAPISEMYSVGSAAEIIRRYEVPPDVANKYFQHIEFTRNRMENRRRELPAVVVDFLAEHQKRKPRSAKLVEPAPSGASHLPPVSSKSQYSGHLPERCQNCGMLTVVIIGRCKQCRTCGDEDGCN